MPIVSIIVPVYKVADVYLHQCLQSLQEQTLEDIEIILIDDGSPDNCGEICDSYALKDRRIKVIHQENQGVSVARNNGMEMASGKWMMFVDADDWLEKDACEKTSNVAEELDADLLCFDGYREWIGSSARISCRLPNRTILSSSYKVSSYADCIFFRNTSALTTVWCKLFRTEEIKDSNVCFSPGYAFSEDRLFMIGAITKLNKIAYLDGAFYHNRARASSAAGNTYRGDMDYHLTRFFNALQENLRANNMATAAAWNAFYSLIVAELKKIICRQIMHPANPLSYRDKLRACNELVRRPIYHDSLRKVDTSLLNVKQKLSYFLIRTHMYSLLSLLQRFWNRLTGSKWYD